MALATSASPGSSSRWQKVSEFCPTLFSSHVSALPNPHTPKGVVVGQSFCLTCRTFAYPWFGQVGHSTVSSAQRDAAGRAHRKDPTDLQVVGRVSHVDLDGGRASACAVHCPPVIHVRLRSVSIRRASFERLNPSRHSVWLRRRLASRRRNFFLIFLSRDRAVGPAISNSFLGSRNSKSCAGSRTTSAATLEPTVRFFVVSFSPAGGRRA
jgi:hypothetical protein